MLGFTASVLFGSACGLRLRILPFLILILVVPVLVWADRMVAGQGFLPSAAQGLLVSCGMQVGYVLGIWIRSVFEARDTHRPRLVRSKHG